jgi:hypothetical protein
MSRPTGSWRSRNTLLRRVLPVAVLALVAGLVLVLTLGDDRSPEGTAAPSPAAPTSAAPAEGTEGPSDPEATPTEQATAATEAVAAPVVVRQGVPESARTVAASQAEFTEPSDWSDGASVRVVEARQQVTGGSGPGVLAGQPQTVFTLELTNGSDASLDLDSVVVQVAYAAGTVQASPLYDDETADFGGDLEPGDSATAVYSFAVPADQTGDVVLSVDVDGTRFPAVFTGAVPVR